MPKQTFFLNIISTLCFDTLSLCIHCINLSLKAINYAVELTVHMGVTVLGRVHWKKLLCFVLPMTGGKEQLRSIILHVELSDGQTGSTLLFCVLNYFDSLTG